MPSSEVAQQLIDIGLAYWMSSAEGQNSFISAAISLRASPNVSPGDPAGQCVTDRLVNAKLTRDVHVMPVRLDATDLEGANHEIGTIQCLPSAARDFQLGAQPVCLDQAPGAVISHGDATGVRVVQ